MTKFMLTCALLVAGCAEEGGAGSRGGGSVSGCQCGPVDAPQTGVLMNVTFAALAAAGQGVWEGDHPGGAGVPSFHIAATVTPDANGGIYVGAVSDAELGTLAQCNVSQTMRDDCAGLTVPIEIQIDTSLPAPARARSTYRADGTPELGLLGTELTDVPQDYAESEVPKGAPFLSGVWAGPETQEDAAAPRAERFYFALSPDGALWAQVYFKGTGTTDPPFIRIGDRVATP